MPPFRASRRRQRCARRRRRALHVRRRSHELTTRAQTVSGAHVMSTTFSSDVAFTPAVKAVQTRKGSRGSYARMEERGGWETRITPDLAQFIEAQTSVFLAT